MTSRPFSQTEIR